MDSFMRLRHKENNLFLDLIGESINTIEFDIHLNSINRLKKFQNLYVNIANLDEINNDVIKCFKKMKSVILGKNIFFINVNPIQNTILNLFEIDKLFQIYMNKQDAIEAKKPVINRKFKLVR